MWVEFGIKTQQAMIRQLLLKSLQFGIIVLGACGSLRLVSLAAVTAEVGHSKEGTLFYILLGFLF